MTETAQKTEPSGRKCPIHKCWFQRIRMGPLEDRHWVKYCPRCDIDRLAKEAKQAAEDRAAGIEKPKLIIRKY